MKVLAVSDFLINYPFATRLFPKALEVLAAANQAGKAAILSDGDVVFQPMKIHRSGVFEAVDGRILIYIHKELELDDITRRYPARHYVLVDDKPRILGCFKKAWGASVTTVLPRQGRYAHDEAELAANPPPDITVERISDLLDAKLSPRLRGP